MARGYLIPWRGGSLTSSGYGGIGGSLFDLHQQMNRLFDDLIDRGAGDGGTMVGASLAAPAMDVHQDERQIEITAELPGVREDDIDLSIDDGILTLSGEKRSEREDRKSGYSERSYGRFERRLTLPANIDEEHCNAEFKDGVLRITIPKAEEKRRGRKIPLGGRQPSDRLAAQNDRQGPMQQAAAEPNREDKGETQPS